MPSRKKPSLRARVLVGGAALAVAGAGVVGTVAANAELPQGTRRRSGEGLPDAAVQRADGLRGRGG
ncbi:hypothetical protein ACWDE9_43390, partial [Streptomyces olivaceoviridis]